MTKRFDVVSSEETRTLAAERLLAFTPFGTTVLKPEFNGDKGERVRGERPTRLVRELRSGPVAWRALRA